MYLENWNISKQSKDYFFLVDWSIESL